MALECACDREREWQARVVLAGFDRIHGLARHPELFRELRLRPIELGAQDPKPVLHRYRMVKMAVPTPQRTAIRGRMKVQLTWGMPTPSRNPYPKVSNAVAPREKPNA